MSVRNPAVTVPAAQPGCVSPEDEAQVEAQSVVSTTVCPLHCPNSLASVMFDPFGNHVSGILVKFASWETQKRPVG